MSLQSFLSTEEGKFVSSFTPLLNTLQFPTHSEEMSKSLKRYRAHAASGFLFVMMSLASVSYHFVLCGQNDLVSLASYLPCLGLWMFFRSFVCIYFLRNKLTCTIFSSIAGVWVKVIPSVKLYLHCSTPNWEAWNSVFFTIISFCVSSRTIAKRYTWSAFPMPHL